MCEARGHRAHCICLPNHKGDPDVHCRPYECLVDPDCPTTLACRNEKCVDPCQCAINADCSARNHQGYCTCRTGYTGDPYGYACTKSRCPFVDPSCRIFCHPDCPFQFLPQSPRAARPTGSVLASLLAFLATVATPASRSIHVWPMLTARSLTPSPGGPCLAPATRASRARETSAARK